MGFLSREVFYKFEIGSEILFVGGYSRVYIAQVWALLLMFIGKVAFDLSCRTKDSQGELISLDSRPRSKN